MVLSNITQNNVDFFYFSKWESSTILIWRKDGVSLVALVLTIVVGPFEEVKIGHVTSKRVQASVSI